MDHRNSFENHSTAAGPGLREQSDRTRLRTWISFGVFERKKPIRNRFAVQGEGGQIVVEYVLLLAVAVMVAAIITRFMISPDTGSPGFVLKTWDEIVTTIGSDHADDIDRGN